MKQMNNSGLVDFNQTTGKIQDAIKALSFDLVER